MIKEENAVPKKLIFVSYWNCFHSEAQIQDKPFGSSFKSVVCVKESLL